MGKQVSILKIMSRVGRAEILEYLNTVPCARYEETRRRAGLCQRTFSQSLSDLIGLRFVEKNDVYKITSRGKKMNRIVQEIKSLF